MIFFCLLSSVNFAIILIVANGFVSVPDKPHIKRCECRSCESGFPFFTAKDNVYICCIILLITFQVMNLKPTFFRVCTIEDDETLKSSPNDR